MSLKQNLAFQNAQSVKSGQVVELLLNKQGELIDYSFCYPSFLNTKNDDEVIQYGIFSFKSDDSLCEIENQTFLTADKAEDFLLEIDFSDFHPHSMPQSNILKLLDII